LNRHKWLLICLLFCHHFLFAQKIDCEKVTSFLNQKENQIAHLNLYDPDYIPLHYLIAQDIIKELEQFRNEVIPYFTECSTITFGELINRYDALKADIQLLYDSLSWLNKKVYLIFYEKALLEYQFKNEIDGEYFLLRSLQYNEIFPNAILLKLNKLLDKNHFEACLSLLNTLYYETELDREQEMQAIEFTDKFYDKLYKTGDSLVKIEHAAEALELFEILEAFCLNLPSSYCNDDYYLGLLRSKSGIYESYLSIAEVAEKRGNPKIAAHFHQYAQEYLEANPPLKNYEHIPIPEKIAPVETLELSQNSIIINRKDAKDFSQRSQNVNFEAPPLSDLCEKSFASLRLDTFQTTSIEVLVEENIILDVENIAITAEKTTSDVENIEPKLSPKEIKEQYDKIVFEALALCISEKFKESYNMFLEAKKMEDCRCFNPDFRVDLMIKELSKFIR